MFLKRKKLKEQTHDDSNAYANRWKDGKITAEEIMMDAARDFMKNAAGFYDFTENLKKDIAERKRTIDKYLGYINQASTNTDYPERGLDINLLRMHKNEYAGHCEWLQYRNQIHLVGGALPFWYVFDCMNVRGDQAFNVNKENMLNLCRLPDVRKRAEEKLNEEPSFIHPGVSAKLPTEEQLSFYYDAVSSYIKLSTKERSGGPEKLSDMFDERGLIKLPDATGTYQLAEKDYFKEYVEVDYKGLV